MKPAFKTRQVVCFFIGPDRCKIAQLSNIQIVVQILTRQVVSNPSASAGSLRGDSLPPAPKHPAYDSVAPPALLMRHPVAEEREITFAGIAGENLAERIRDLHYRLDILGLARSQPQLRRLLIHMNIQRNQQRLR